MKSRQEGDRKTTFAKERNVSKRKHLNPGSPSSSDSKKHDNVSDKIVYTKAFYLRQEQNKKSIEENSKRRASRSPKAHSNSVASSRDDSKAFVKKPKYKAASINKISKKKQLNQKQSSSQQSPYKTEVYRKSARSEQTNIKSEAQDSTTEPKFNLDSSQKNSNTYSSIHNVKVEIKDQNIIIPSQYFNETKKSILEKKLSFKDKKLDAYNKGKLAGEVIKELQDLMQDTTDEKNKEIHQLHTDLRLCKKQNEHYQKLIDNLTFELESSLETNKKILHENYQIKSFIKHFEDCWKDEKNDHIKIKEECLGFVDAMKNALENMPSFRLRKGLNQKVQNSLDDIETYIGDFEDIVNDHVAECQQKNVNNLENQQAIQSNTEKINQTEDADKTDSQVKNESQSQNNDKNENQDLMGQNLSFKVDNQNYPMFNGDTFIDTKNTEEGQNEQRNCQPRREISEKVVDKPGSENNFSSTNNDQTETNNIFGEDLQPKMQESCDHWENLCGNYENHEIIRKNSDTVPTKNVDKEAVDPTYDPRNALRPSLTGVTTEMVYSDREIKPALQHKCTAAFGDCRQINEDAESNSIKDISEIIEYKIKRSDLDQNSQEQNNAIENLATFGLIEQDEFQQQKDNNLSEENYPQEKLLQNMQKEEKDYLVYESMSGNAFPNLEKDQKKLSSIIHNRGESFPNLVSEDFRKIAPESKKPPASITKNDRFLTKLCKPLRKRSPDGDKNNNMFRKKFSYDVDGVDMKNRGSPRNKNAKK